MVIEDVKKDKKVELETVLQNCKDDAYKKGINGFIGIRSLRLFEKYLQDILTVLSGHVSDIEVYCTNMVGGNYVNCSCSIYFKTSTMSTKSISFNIQELYNNCSSVVIHHFGGSNLVSAQGSFSYTGLFNTQDDYNLFMIAIETLLSKVAGYTNMFYNPASVSEPSFLDYCKTQCKLIDTFFNKRNTSTIYYYSKRLS